MKVLKTLLTAISLQFTVFGVLSSVCQAQTGSWRAYLSYHEPQQIVKAGQTLFVRASNDLYQYNLSDQSITTFDRMGQLSDTQVAQIAWNPTVKKLLIVYSNYNIDLMTQQGDVFNISSYYSRSTTLDKTIHTIRIHDRYAYLGTAFGVVKINMQRQEISETYVLNKPVSAIGLDATHIYVQSGGEVLSGLLTTNLIDPHNWTSATTVPDGIFAIDQSDWQDYLPLVQTLNPGGPKYNRFGFMRFKNGMLYTTDGGLKQGMLVDMATPATIQMLNRDRQWNVAQDDVKGRFPGTEGNWQYVDLQTVDADPTDTTHLFAGGRTGLFEFRDGRCVNFFYPENSPLERTIDNDNNYIKIESVLFDGAGNLWMLQSQARTNCLLHYDKSGEWTKYPHTELFFNNWSLSSAQHLMADSRGLFWFVNNHFNKPSFYCYNPETDQIIHEFTSFKNQDGISYGEATYYPRALAEDRDGKMWVGTSIGLFMLDKKDIGTQSPNLQQIKVARNDGTELADYLLGNANITAIVVDGGNRKWVATAGTGVYLISADNEEELHHFTFENSPLLSNNVESMALDPESGEVFFGTDKGLCSYLSDATEPTSSMNQDDVYAFPNPVPPGYRGLITVRGLSFDADVKILSTDGRLVYEGRSNGGTFTWNGHDRSGRRVASGVYMIATATSSGDKGVAGKIAIVN